MYLLNIKINRCIKYLDFIVKELSIKLHIPQTLKEIGIPKEMLPTLAEQALHDACTGGNPREVTKEDILALYKEAYE